MPALTGWSKTLTFSGSLLKNASVLGQLPLPFSCPSSRFTGRTLLVLNAARASTWSFSFFFLKLLVERGKKGTKTHTHTHNTPRYRTATLINYRIPPPILPNPGAPHYLMHPPLTRRPTPPSQLSSPWGPRHLPLSLFLLAHTPLFP